MEKNTLIKTPVLKNIFDKILCLILLFFLSPLIIIIIFFIYAEGLVITTNKGPIFYKEIRISQGKPFLLYKFRIFKQGIIDVMKKKNQFIETKQIENTPNSLTYTGQLLKKFYLDELAQLVNILNGDMTFVGPRPWNTKDYEDEIAQGVYRKKIIKAGLLGLVQIHKGEWDKHNGQIALDNHYIQLHQTRSSLYILCYDIGVIIRGIIVLFKGKGY